MQQRSAVNDHRRHELSRRILLKLLGVAGAAAATGCATSSASDTTAVTAKKRVVVLGAGLAGMCAAHELRKAGHTVVAVLEAQDRVGGRVRTHREGFKNGQYCELGATRIADSHNFTLAYIDEFRLEKREFGSGKSCYYAKGKRWVHDDGDAWPADVFPNLMGEDRTMGADSLVLKYEQISELIDPMSPKYMGNPNTALWPNDNDRAKAILAQSIEQFLKSNGASDDVFVIDRLINGSELFSDSALYWLAADIDDAKWDKTFAIKGGNDQLPKAFATALGDLIKFGCKVTAIEEGAKDATVTFDQNGKSQTLTADVVVCALPFTILRNIRTPSLPADKLEVVNKLKMMNVSRCNMQVKSRFWTGEGIGGLKVARTDTSIDRLWHGTDVQDGDSGILVAYMQNQTGLDYVTGGADEASRIARVRGIVKNFFPQIDSEFLYGMEWVWQNDPFVKGAWGYFGPGEQGMFPIAKRPDGRIHFCGEHTSSWSGWMQGAFESARRVVAEIG